jgi:hypothetical protein
VKRIDRRIIGFGLVCITILVGSFVTIVGLSGPGLLGELGGANKTSNSTSSSMSQISAVINSEISNNTTVESSSIVSSVAVQEEPVENTTPAYIPPVSTSGTRIMVFRGIPSDVYQAEEFGNDDVYLYQRFANNGWTPIVVLEPDTARSDAFATTGYWKAVERYYTILKQAGITDAMLGEQIIFSEANTHQVWGAQINPTASSYKSNLQKYINTMKAVFPGANSAALLDGFTFAVADEDWQSPSTLNISAYLSGVSGLNTFYVQGFPWLSPSDPGEDRRDAFEYTHLNTLKQSLGLLQSQGTTVGINTGAMVSQRTGGRKLSPEQVRAQAEGILLAVQGFQSSTGTQLKVNIFTENKLNLAEGKNWDFPSVLSESYYQDWKSRVIGTGAWYSEFRQGQ